jgi:uroporphyrinogen-III synthase
MLTKPVNVLFTRPLDAILAQKASLRKVLVDTAKFIETKTTTEQAIIASVRATSDKAATVIFTSTNAVEAVVSFIAHKPNWDIYCIGGATKDAVIEVFGEAAIKSLAKSAANLAEKIITAGDVEKVVFFCGDQRLTTLPETLAANGIVVEELVVYNTELTPQIVEKNYHGVAFFSPSAVHSFFSENTVATSVILFAIGKTTAATIASYCSNKIVTCEWPGSEQMLDTIIYYFEKN